MGYTVQHHEVYMYSMEWCREVAWCKAYFNNLIGLEDSPSFAVVAMRTYSVLHLWTHKKVCIHVHEMDQRGRRQRGTHTSSDTAMKSLSECSSSISCVPACSAEATPTGSGGPGGGTGEESAVKAQQETVTTDTTPNTTMILACLCTLIYMYMFILS